MASDDGQLSTTLPHIKSIITTHDPTTGHATAHSTRPAAWQAVGDRSVAFNVVYTTDGFPPSLNDDADIAAHDATLASGTLGLVKPGGTVCRIVDFAPGHTPLMHRTQSLDYGVVLEGVVEMELDSGEVHVLRRGDVAVQRATMHAWRNTSETECARMLFVLQDCAPVVVGGSRLKEDLGHAAGSMVKSGNDD